MTNRNSSRSAWTVRLLCSTALALVLPCVANANPQDGQVAAGTATIVQTNPQTLSVNQMTQKAVINWRSFSIGQGETTTFNQPSASAITLNRVTGVNPSSIMGNLTANGQVWLVNPNGIAFGKSARVDVAGLLATTIDINDRDFMSGNYRFSSLGNPSAMVTNAGQITVRNAGLAALVAPGVENFGLIQANLGQIQLSSAAAFTVDLYGDGLFNFTLDKQVTQAIKKPDGTKPAAAVSNSGQLIANGGRILLTAKAAKSVVDHAINMDGYAQATSASVSATGEIVLDGGSEGVVHVAGAVDASGQSGATGGNIHITGQDVQLASSSKIDASGASGGIVSVISQGNTTAAGTIVARNTDSARKGGTVETSGHNLSVSGYVDAGHGGTWLLDPYDLTVDAAAASTIGTTLNAGTDVTLTTSTSSASGPGVQNASGNGDILVNSSVNWSTGAALTLSAYRDVVVNNSVVIANTGAGNLNLRADNTGISVGTVSFNGTGKVDFSGSTGFVSIFYNSADNPAGSVVNATSYSSPTNYAPHVNTNASVHGQVASYMLVNSAYDLQNIQNNLSGTYALGRDIDASTTATWNAGFGFIPIAGNGDDTGILFTGTFSGENHTIVGLVINSDNTDVGLFGDSIGTVKNVGLVGASVIAGSSSFHVGTLVGWNNNDGTSAGSIVNSYATGQVSGGKSVGGLVGGNEGSIVNSYAAGAVSGAEYDAGGLVGENNDNGTISNSYATGAVTGKAGSWDAGGLVGINYFGGAISNSYATGAVSGTSSVAGGLAGENDASIATSYASGAVSDTNPGSTVGGFVGANSGGAISQSYWDSGTTLQSVGVGSGGGAGATGLTSAHARTESSYSGWDFTNTWFMIDGNTRPFLRAEYSTTIGNAHQLQLIDIDLNATYTLAGDIDMGELANASGLWNPTSGFVPIGSSSSPFMGALFGNGHTINALFINSEYEVGLFGYIGTAGKVSGVGLTNANITADYGHGPDYAGVGGIAGINDGVVDQSYVSGSIHGNTDCSGGLIGCNRGVVTNSYSSADVSADDRVGGLVGWNDLLWGDPLSFYPTQAGSISKSYATGTVTGGPDAENAGGLVGRNEATACYEPCGPGPHTSTVFKMSATIDQSYATGNVHAGDSADIGGLVGTNFGSITRSYSTGSVSDSGTGTYVGALVGTMHDMDVDPVLGTTGLISESYATGHVTDTLWTKVGSGGVTISIQGGGLVGFYGGAPGTESATIINSYWDVQTTGRTIGSGSGESVGTGLATAALQGSLPIGFNSSYWVASAGAYPKLRWQLPSPPPPVEMLITWKVADSSSTYGTLATLGAVSLTGVQSADAGSLSATVGLFNGNLAVALSPSLAAGTYSEEVVALTGSSAGKYVLAATGNTMGTLTINPAQLSITVFDFSRTYGDPNPWWFSSRISGLKAGDDENSVGLAYSTTGTRTAAVGTYPISATITSQNYVVVSNTSGTLTITQRPLSWSVGNVSLTYGTSPSLGTAALSNVIGSDNVTGVVALFDSQNQFLPSRTTSVGQYQEKVVSLTGSAAGNYSCCNVGSWGYYTVTPKTLNWSVSNNTSTYGSYPTFGTPTLSGIVGADDVFGLVGLLGVASPSPTTPVGTYTEYVRGLAGGRAGNYVLAPNGTYGTLIIQQPPGYTSYVAQSSSTNNQKTTSTSNNTTPTTSTQNATQSLPPAPVGTLLSYSFTSTANTTPAKATPTSTVMAAISKQAPQLQGYLSDKLVDTAIKAAINIGMSTSNFTTQDWVDFVTGYFKSQGYRSLINNSVGGALTKGAAISVLADLSGEISAWIAKRNGASDGIAEFDKNLTGFVVTGLIAGPQAEALSASVKIIESGTQLTLLNISNFQGAIATAEDLANKADALAKDSLARGDHAQAAFYLKIANNERMAIVTIRNEHPVVATMIEIPGTISRFLNWLF